MKTIVKLFIIVSITYLILVFTVLGIGGYIFKIFGEVMILGFFVANVIDSFQPKVEKSL